MYRAKLDAFLDFISAHERAVFKAALTYNQDGKFPSTTQETLLSVLSRFGCRQLLTPTNLKPCIEHFAQYEFVSRPAAAIYSIYSGIPITHQRLWMKKTVSGMSSVYDNLTVSPVICWCCHKPSLLMRNGCKNYDRQHIYSAIDKVVALICCHTIVLCPYHDKGHIYLTEVVFTVGVFCWLRQGGVWWRQVESRGVWLSWGMCDTVGQ